MYKRQFSKEKDSWPKRYSKDKENCDLTGHIYSGNKKLQRVKSHKDIDETVDNSKLKQKYDKLKKVRKEMIKHIK